MADNETTVLDHLRLLSYVAFLGAAVFLGPLAAALGLALAWLVLPEE